MTKPDSYIVRITVLLWAGLLVGLLRSIVKELYL